MGACGPGSKGTSVAVAVAVAVAVSVAVAVVMPLQWTGVERESKFSGKAIWVMIPN